MQVSELGEFGLIERFRKSIKTDASVIKGSGDDCAVLAFDKNNYQLFTCDMIVEGVDFTLKDGPFLIGRKALAVSLSDIAGCGGIPRHCVVSLGMPRDTRVNFIDKLFSGLSALAKEYKVNIVGGDISRAPRIIVDLSLLGLVEKKRLVLRNGAKTNDLIFVTGSIGGSSFGKHLNFTPRLKEARYLVENFKINSMIDISDGLAQDLRHLLEESRCGGIIFESLVPLSAQAKDFKTAVAEGEDFELLFTLSRKEAGRLLKRNANKFFPIGQVRDNKYGVKLLGRSNLEIDFSSDGFRHF